MDPAGAVEVADTGSCDAVAVWSPASGFAAVVGPSTRCCRGVSEVRPRITALRTAPTTLRVLVANSDILDALEPLLEGSGTVR